MVLTLDWDLEKMNDGQDQAPPRANELSGLKGQNESQSGRRYRGKRKVIRNGFEDPRAWLWKARLRSLILSCVQKKAMGRLNYITITLLALGEWLWVRQEGKQRNLTAIAVVQEGDDFDSD